MSTFIQAMDAGNAATQGLEESKDSQSLEGKNRGENGTVQWTHEGVGDMNVSIFNQTVRNMSKDQLEEMIEKSLSGSSLCAEPRVSLFTMVDLVLLCFSLRNCRGGKGEKKLFYWFFLRLHKEFPQTFLTLLPLIPHYGYYKDLFNLLEELPAPEAQNDAQSNLRTAIFTMIRDQLHADEIALNKYENDRKKNLPAGSEGSSTTMTTTINNKLELSLLAKYMPRRNGHFDKGANKWIYTGVKNALYPDPACADASAQYRRLVSRLTTALDVTEVKMCDWRYQEIKFEKVASRCMNKFNKAFLNEKKGVPLTSQEEETGNRFPYTEDRVRARKNLRDVLMDSKLKKINGRQLQPHEIVTRLSPYDHISNLECELFQAQWNAIREGVIESLQSTNPSLENGQNTDNEGGGINLGKLVPLIDVSGSMTGIPMEVAIAMGILVSEVNHPNFRNRFITFDASPTWVVLDPESSIEEKVLATRAAPWGMNTDFVKAMNLIANVVKQYRLPQEDIPNLIVFSDMQFDEAVMRECDKDTMHTQIKEMFQKLGMDICGQPYEPPMIVYWNLRATDGNVVQDDENNTMMLSGFSPSMLKLILAGEALSEEIVTVDENGNEKREIKKVTPWDTMRLALDDELYNPVREVLYQSREAPFDDYTPELNPDFAENETTCVSKTGNEEK